MKKLILNLIILFSVSPMVQAQHFELSAGANTGLFAYKGAGATTSTELIQDYQNASYANNPYGSKYAFSYGAFIQPQYVFKSGFLVGLQGSYDIWRSKAAVTGVFPYYSSPYLYNSSISLPLPASGADILQAEEININPYIGYRINAGTIKVDVMPGVSFGFDLNAREKGNASTTGLGSSEQYRSNNKLPNLRTDVQLKLGAGAEWHRWALVASYAYGLSDIAPIQYANPVVLFGGAPPPDNTGSGGKIHSSLFELGISYRLFTTAIKQ